MAKGPQNPRNPIFQHCMFLGSILVMCIPDLGLKKPATWKCQQAQTKKAPTKACSLEPKDQKRHIITRQKTLRTKPLYSRQTSQKKTMAPPRPAKLGCVAQISIYSPGGNKAPPTPPHEGDAEEAR